MDSSLREDSHDSAKLNTPSASTSSPGYTVSAAPASRVHTYPYQYSQNAWPINNAYSYSYTSGGGTFDVGSHPRPVGHWQNTATWPPRSQFSSTGAPAQAPAPTPSPSPLELSRQWGVVIKTFLVSSGLTQALRGLELDLLALNEGHERTVVPLALKTLQDNLLVCFRCLLWYGSLNLNK